jgi:hypothetical protein
MRIWQPDFRPANPQTFMDRYVDFQLQRISAEPIDIFAVPTFIPTTPRVFRLSVHVATQVHTTNIELTTAAVCALPRLRMGEHSFDALKGKWRRASERPAAGFIANHRSAAA